MRACSALLIVVCFGLSRALSAEPAISVVYEPTNTDADVKAKTIMQMASGIPLAISLLNELLIIDQNITLRLGAEEGPLYDPQLNEIWLPYTFAQDIGNRFSAAGLSEDDEHAIQITQDVLTHTVFHEVGHALVALYELPILGREEDAVDSLANVLMLEYYEQGSDAALNAADMFGLESEDTDTFDDQDFWASHSLDIQRYYTTVCHVFGSAPEHNAFLIEDELLSAERGEECIEEYGQISNSWLDVLEPYMAKD